MFTTRRLRLGTFIAIAGLLSSGAAACGGSDGAGGSGGAGAGGHGSNGSGGPGGAAAPGAPELIYKGSCIATTLADWDPSAPWPLLSFSLNGDKFSVNKVHVDDAKKELSCAEAGTAFVWGWKSAANAPEVVFDLPTAGSGTEELLTKLDGWNESAPWPIIAMARSGGVWTTQGIYAVGADGSVSMTSSADRIVVWQLEAPRPKVLHSGAENELLIPWDPSSPPPLVPFIQGTALVFHRFFALGADGKAIPGAGSLIVWGW